MEDLFIREEIIDLQSQLDEARNDFYEGNLTEKQYEIIKHDLNLSIKDREKEIKRMKARL